MKGRVPTLRGCFQFTRRSASAVQHAAHTYGAGSGSSSTIRRPLRSDAGEQSAAKIRTTWRNEHTSLNIGPVNFKARSLGASHSSTPRDEPLGAAAVGGIEADRDASRAILSLVNQGRLDDAMLRLSKVSEEGVMDSDVALRLIEACDIEGRWILACEVLRSPAVKRDDRVVAAVILACGRASKWREGLAVLTGEGTARGWRPGPEAYRAAVVACAINAEESATELLKLVDELDFPGEVQLDSLISMCTVNQGEAGALLILRHLLNSQPDPVARFGMQQLEHAVTLALIGGPIMVSRAASQEAASGGAPPSASSSHIGQLMYELWTVARKAGLDVGDSSWPSSADLKDRPASLAVEAFQWARRPRRGVVRAEVDAAAAAREVQLATAALQMCIKVKDWDSAIRLLQMLSGDGAALSLPSSGEALVSAVMECGVHGGPALARHALEIFDMVCEGQAVMSRTAIWAMAVRCHEVLDGEGGGLRWLLTRLQKVNSSSSTEAAGGGVTAECVCATMLEQLSREGRVDQAVKLLKEMRGWGIKREARSLELLLHSMSTNKRLNDVHWLLQDVEKKDDVTLGSQAYITALYAACHSGDVSRLMFYLKFLREKGVRISRSTYTTVLKVLGDYGEWEKALLVLDDMRTPIVMPQAAGFQSLAQEAAPAVRDHAKVVEEEDRELQARQQQRQPPPRGPSLPGLQPGVIAYTTAINACANGGAWEVALLLVERMLKERIIPNVYTYTAAIKACGRAGRAEQAEALFRLMSARGLTPNIWTYTAMLDAYAKSGKKDEAAALLRRMEAQKGVEVRTPHYTVVMDACEIAGDYVGAIKWFQVLKDKGLALNQIPIAVAIKACGKVDAWDEACVLWRGIEEDTGKPADHVPLMALFEALGRCNRWPVAMYMYEWERRRADGGVHELTIGAVNALICALDDMDLDDLSDVVYRDAFRAGLVNHRSPSYEGVIDLHKYSRSLAKAAVRYVLRDIVTQHGQAGMPSEATSGGLPRQQPVVKDLVIVTGHGMTRNSGTSVLKSELKDFVAQEYEFLQLEDVVGNPGRVVIPGGLLSRWLVSSMSGAKGAGESLIRHRPPPLAAVASWRKHQR